MPQNTRADILEIQHRVDTVKAMLVKGVEPYEIVRACIEKHADWDVQKRQIKNYIYTAQEQLHQDAAQIDFAGELMLAKMQWEYSIYLAAKISDVKSYQAGIKGKQELLNLSKLRYEAQWKDAARADGYDPDALLKGLMPSGLDIVVMDEVDELLNEDDRE